MPEKTVLVTGATGAQGGSVARHLLRSGNFSVRCLTRKPDGDAARALSDAGAEVVQGDLSDRSSLASAMRGCWGLFGVTNFWEVFDKEVEQGRNLVDAALEAKIEHAVMSTLPHVKKTTGLDVPHFDTKAQYADYARERDLPMAELFVAFYYENFLAFFPPKKQEDGSFAFGFPQGDEPMAGVSVEDIGGIVLAMFDKPEKFRGRHVYAVGDIIPPQEYAQVMSRVTGERVVYQHIDRETFAGFGFPGAEDLANMFEYYRKHPPYSPKDLEESRSLHPQLRTFAQWAEANAAALKRAMQG